MNIQSALAFSLAQENYTEVEDRKNSANKTNLKNSLALFAEPVAFNLLFIIIQNVDFTIISLLNAQTFSIKIKRIYFGKPFLSPLKWYSNATKNYTDGKINNQSIYKSTKNISSK